MALASGAQEGLPDHVLQSFPSQNALQQVVQRARKIRGATSVDLKPDELQLVRTHLLACRVRVLSTPMYGTVQRTGHTSVKCKQWS